MQGIYFRCWPIPIDPLPYCILINLLVKQLGHLLKLQELHRFSNIPNTKSKYLDLEQKMVVFTDTWHNRVGCEFHLPFMGALYGCKA